MIPIKNEAHTKNRITRKKDHKIFRDQDRRKYGRDLNKGLFDNIRTEKKLGYYTRKNNYEDTDSYDYLIRYYSRRSSKPTRRIFRRASKSTNDNYNSSSDSSYNYSRRIKICLDYRTISRKIFIKIKYIQKLEKKIQI